MNKNGVKLLTMIAVLAMVFAAFTVVIDDSEGGTIGLTKNVDVGNGYVIGYTAGLDVELRSGKYVFSGIAYNDDTETVNGNAFATRGANYAYAKITVPMGSESTKTLWVEQTNSALVEYSGDVNITNTNGVYMKADQASLSSSDHDLYFLIPKDGSSVKIQFFTYDTQKGDLLKTIEMDFTKVYTKVVLSNSNIASSDTKTPNGWYYAKTGTTLYLNNYSGNEIFSASGALNVNLTGTNVFSPSFNNGTLGTDERVGVISAVSALKIDGTGSLRINADIANVSIGGNLESNKIAAIYGGNTVAIENTGSLQITVTGDVNNPDYISATPSGNRYVYSEAIYGIYGAGKVTIGKDAATTQNDQGEQVTTPAIIVPVRIQVAVDSNLAFAISGAATSDYKMTGSVEGGNRAIQVRTSATFDQCGTESSYLTLIGSEKAIQAKEGSVSVTGSYLDLQISGNKEYNPGDNDVFGIKVNTLSVTSNSVIKTQGMNLTGTGAPTITASKIIISGDYEQNGNTNLDKIISGFYNKTTSTTIPAISIDSISDATVAEKIYVLGDAETYGNISVTDKDGKTEQSVVSSSIDTDAITNALASADTVVVLLGNTSVSGLNVTVSDNKEIQIITAGTGTITGVFKNGNNSINLNTVKGSFTITKGSVIIDGVINEGSITAVSGDVTVKGTISGDVAINVDTTTGKTATLTLADGLTINDGCTLTITGVYDSTSKKSSMSVLVLEGSTVNLLGTGKIALVDSNMSIMGSVLGINGAIDASTNSNVYVDTGAIVTSQFTGTGTFFVDDAMREFKISQDIVSDVTTTAQQKVFIEKSITIYPGATLRIAGELEVADGMKITIKDGGKLIINGVNAKALIEGQIIVEGANGFSFTGKTLTVDGSVDVKADSSTSAFSVNGNTIINGTVTIGSKAKATFTSGITVNEEGTLQIDGTVSGNVQSNYGIVIVNGTSADFTINMQNGGAVDVKSINGTVTITDLGMKMAVGNTVQSAKANTITLFKVQGIQVTSFVKISTNDDGTKKYTNQMFVSGTASDLKSSTSGLITVSAGTISLASDATLDLGKVAMLVSSGATFSVAGKVIATNEDFRGFSGSGVVKVSGEIKTRASEDIEDNLSGLQAVKYTIKENDVEYNIYTTLASAIKADAKDLMVIGLLTISKDTTVPAGVEVKADSGIQVNEDVLFIISKGSVVTTTTINVNGTMEVENNDDLTCNSIYSDTSAVTETTGRYTNIQKALADAQSGETIKITKKANAEAYVYLRNDATVKEGVILEIPASKSLVISEGVTFTIDGKLYLNNGKLYSNAYEASDASDDITGKFGIMAKKVTGVPQAAVVIVNGSIESTYELTYVAPATSGETEGVAASGYAIAGAYYGIKAKYYISPVETAADLVSSIEGKVIDIKGKNTVGDVSFVGTDEEPVTVNIIATTTISAENMSVTYGSIRITSGAVVDGEYGNAVGSVKVVNMISGGFNIADQYNIVNGESVQVLRISGSMTANQSAIVKEASVVLDGKIEIITSTAFNVVYKASASDYKAGSVFIADSAEIVIKKVGSYTGSLTTTGSYQSSGTQYVPVTVRINGSVSAINNASLTMDVAEVYGTLTEGVADADGNVVGNVSVGSLYVGLAVADVLTTSGVATINGDVAVDGLMYVLDGCSVPSDMIKNKDSVKFIVEGKAWMTVYKIGSTSTVKVNTIPVANAELISWINESETTLADNNITISGNKVLEAKIDYKIYTVKINVAEGIDDVYMDGVLVKGGSVKVAFGEHTVSYTLANGYSGNATMLVDGDKVAGYKFAATADPSVDITITLQGIEKSGYVPDSPDTPVEDKGMGITDYLLIVLVILAAILVVIVAIRMMRS